MRVRNRAGVGVLTYERQQDADIITTEGVDQYHPPVDSVEDEESGKRGSDDGGDDEVQTWTFDAKVPRNQGDKVLESKQICGKWWHCGSSKIDKVETEREIWAQALCLCRQDGI